MKTFDKYENRERKFINWLIDLREEHKLDEISPVGSYQRNDFIMISGHSYVLAEVKIRSFEWDKYQTAVIELDKIKSLAEMFQPFNQMGEKNRLLYYAVYPKSRTILVFDILNTPSTLTYEYSPVATAINIGNKYKTMVNYKINEAIEKITY